MIIINDFYSKKLLPKLALFMASFIWGSSFFIMKNTVDVFPPFILLGFRFTIAGILLSAVFWKRVKQINKEYILKGSIIGFLLFLGYVTQTIGITETTPGKNAFLTAIYCVIVPFLFWAVDKSKPDKYSFIAALVCISGIGLVSLKGDFTVGFGDAFTLLGGFLFAGHLVAIAKLGKGRDPIILTILQFGFAALFSWSIGLVYEDFPPSWGMGNMLGLLYLAVFASAVAMLFQNIGQKWTHPSAAAIILSLESVFGVLFSIVFYGEQLTLRLIIGFVLIFVAIIISETKLSFIGNILRVKTHVDEKV